MKIESPAFTLDDIKAFMDTYRERERDLLTERLQRVSNRLAELGPRVVTQPGDADDWNAHELLAHIALVSKFYGVLVHRVASGKMADLNLLEAVNLRDIAGQQLAQTEPSELLQQALSDQQRTIATLRSTGPDALQQRARVDDGTALTAEEIARLPLITHLEMHIEQLERLLDR